VKAASIAIVALLATPVAAEEAERVAAATTQGPTVDAAVEQVDPKATDAAGEKPWIRPFVAVVGGLEIETLVNRPGDDREGRAVTVALSRFGLRAGVSPGIYIESEFEANAGPHGSSAWEGQAALSVRNQLVRLERGRFRVDAGRITDPASLDFVSDHVLDQLLTDGYTRGSLLASGFNRGNGVLGQVEIFPGGRVGLTINAANPVSTTSSLVVGGTFPPFARFYFAPYQYVGRDAANFPADEYHFVMVSPSALIDRDRFALHAALQMFQVNTDTSRSDDQHIDGFNARVTTMARFLDRRLRAYGSASIVQNEVVDPDDGTRLSGEIYSGTSLGGGIDVDAPPIAGRRAGAGVMLSVVRDRQGARALANQLFLNVGTTYWLGETTALGARFGLYRRCEDLDGAGCTVDGERSFFMTLRTQI
jgi:hypothetical protein